MKFHQTPNTFVGQVSINVTNLEKSLAFYKDVIGFQLLNQTDRSADLTADGLKTLLTIEEPEDVIPKEERKTGLYHFAILMPNRSDLANIVKHFADLGVRFASSDHLVSEALYLNDPDGNGIEIYTDRPDSTWDWHNKEVKMAVDPLDFEELLSELNGEWKGLPDRTVMGHIHLHVSELQKTEEFYKEGLGFDTVSRLGNQALFMSTGSYHHHIGLNTWNGVGAPAPSKNSVGINWFSLVYPTEEARAKAIDRLEKIGSRVIENNGVYETVDPSGNHVQLWL